MSSGDRNNPDPSNQAIFDRVMADPQVKANFERVYKINRTKQIPYLAGYSQDGHTIFIDENCPDGFAYRANGIDKWISTDEFLALHERIEKALTDAINAGNEAIWRVLPHAGDDADDPYFPTHGVATFGEEHAVLIMWGQAVLDAYRKFMTQQVKRAGAETLTKVPGNLDMNPYIPAETPEDFRVVAAMQKAMQD